MVNKQSQKYRILKHLKRHRRITSMEAFTKFNATRLSGIIYNLREDGFNINTERIVKNGKSFGRYYLIENDTNDSLLHQYFLQDWAVVNG
jgi:hypothetical protein